MSNPNRRLVSLSKFMSLVLRHNPGLLDLALDPAGFTPVELLRERIGEHSEYSWVTLADILAIVTEGTKPRFELQGVNIRARWGHSIQEQVAHPPAEPPPVLYHGTSARAAKAILKDGLRPMSRQYVHLSRDQATALNVGSRHDRAPLLLRVSALDAWKAGVMFHCPHPMIWLSPGVPANFIARE